MRACTALVAALMLNACSDAGDGGTAASAGDTSATSEPSTQVLLVTMQDTSIVLSLDSVPAGPVSFLIGNRGDARHSLRIEGATDGWSVGLLGRGEDATLRVDLQPGVYEVFCPEFDAAGTHASQGQHARLIVGPASDEPD